MSRPQSSFLKVFCLLIRRFHGQLFLFLSSQGKEMKASVVFIPQSQTHFLAFFWAWPFFLRSPSSHFPKKKQNCFVFRYFFNLSTHPFFAPCCCPEETLSSSFSICRNLEKGEEEAFPGGRIKPGRRNTKEKVRNCPPERKRVENFHTDGETPWRPSTGVVPSAVSALGGPRERDFL